MHRTHFTHALSFAKDNLDLLLGIVFEGETGSYVDIGADHPVLNSATHTLAAKGWRGYNITGHRRIATAFTIERPADRVVKIGSKEAVEVAPIVAWAKESDGPVCLRFDAQEAGLTPKALGELVEALKPGLVIAANLTPAQQKALANYEVNLRDDQGAAIYANSKALAKKVAAAQAVVQKSGAVPQCVVAEIAKRDIEIAYLKDKLEDAKKTQEYIDELTKEIQRKKRLRHQVVELFRSLDKAAESILGGHVKPPTAEPLTEGSELLSSAELYERIRAAYDGRADTPAARGGVRKGLLATYNTAKKPLHIVSKGMRKVLKRR